MRRVAPVLALLASAPLQAQDAPIGPHCAAAVCEEGTIYAVAIDTLWRAQAPPPLFQPRVLSAVYLVPFGPRGDISRTPLGDFSLIDSGMLTRYWPHSTIVDSASAVQADGHSLSSGGTLYAVGPIDWTGPDSARLQLAEYPKDLLGGAQYFVWVERGPMGWRVSRVKVGWQN